MHSWGKHLFAGLLSLWLYVPVISQISISAVRNLPVGSVVTTTGVLNSGNEFGGVRFMQDAVAGIALYDESMEDLREGDSIIVTGTLSVYRGQLQISPVFSYSLISEGNDIPPMVIDSIAGVNRTALNARKIILTCCGIASCEAELESGWYVLYDQYGQTIRLSIADNHPVEGFPLLDRPVVIEGILSELEDQDQLLCSSISDASEGNCHYISPPQLGFLDNEVQLSWSDLPEAFTAVSYGIDTFDNVVSLGMTGGDLTITPDALLLGSIYVARVTQINEEGNIFHSIPIQFSQPSETEPIQILFNRSVNTSFSDGSSPLATGSSAIELDLISRIDEVTSTLDIAMYNTGRASIVQAVERAVDRGVVVRYIADDETSNNALDGPPSFPVLYRSGDGIMHNKFVIADVNDPQRAWLWTGSTNLSANQLSTDPNHALILHDQAIARSYQLEFDEMWGNTAAQQQPRYGDFKTNNTVHSFQNNDILIESWFSPSDETNCRLIEALRSADHQALIGLLLLTRLDLADEIIELHQRGLDVRVIVDDEESSASALSRLRAAGVRVVTHDPNPIFHHKYAIIDEGHPDSDPLVVSGSHNWTWSADNINDENTLIIHDQSVTNIFRQEYEARWRELNPTATLDPDAGNITVYPNPAHGAFTIINPLETGFKLSLVNLLGQTVHSQWIGAGEEATVNPGTGTATGLFLLVSEHQGHKQAIQTIVLQ